jgi:ketosteroid isomerase-like protein
MTISLDSPNAVEFAFYQAFEQNDLSAMMALWENADDVVCVHPLGPALRGFAAVEASWREILSGGTISFAIEEVRVSRTGPIAIHIVKEHIQVPDGKPVAPMIATNVYRETADGWRMVLHHASPSPGTSMGGAGPLVH